MIMCFYYYEYLNHFIHDAWQSNVSVYNSAIVTNILKMWRDWRLKTLNYWHMPVINNCMFSIWTCKVNDKKPSPKGVVVAKIA